LGWPRRCGSAPRDGSGPANLHFRLFLAATEVARDSPILRRQRRPPPAPRAGLQSRQFHADAGDAEDRGAVVAPGDEVRCHSRRRQRYALMNTKQRVSAQRGGHLAVLAFNESAAIEFRCRGTPRDGRSRPTTSVSGKCRLICEQTTIPRGRFSVQPRLRSGGGGCVSRLTIQFIVE
jgi:hypothetical protein